MGNCCSSTSSKDDTDPKAKKRTPGIAYTIGESDEDDASSLVIPIEESNSPNSILIQNGPPSPRSPFIPISHQPSPHIPPPQSEVADPLVQRIANEIAEFREQLRRGQEQIMVMSNSVQRFDTIRSCPSLVEDSKEVPPPPLPEGVVGRGSLVTIGTQTEEVMDKRMKIKRKSDSGNGLGDDDFYEAPSSSETFHGLGEEDLEPDEEMDDDGRYRVRGGSEALSVIEESEHESSEVSSGGTGIRSGGTGGSLQRKMSSTSTSSDRGPRPKLIRMRNTIEDPPSCLNEDDLKSDLEYLSAASSLSSRNPSVYNSLERPLHVSSSSATRMNGNSNGDDQFSDCSYSSINTTTYGSPISSPSSPTYLTPSQGSSSQETLTNHDGDKTPVNLEDLLVEDEEKTQGCHLKSNRTPNTTQHHSSFQRRKAKTSSWQMLPIDNRQGTTSIGVIPDEDQEHMRQYAYDVTLRSCDPDAAILSRKEWRTLHSDLDQVDLAKFKKSYGQEEDTDKVGILKSTSSSLRGDLDELAESYSEQFPFLAESIFQYLDTTAQEKVESLEQLPDLKKRFEELAITFRTDHEKLDGRTEMVKTEYETARKRVTEIIALLKRNLQKIHLERLSEEVREVFMSLENSVEEIELHSETLDRAAKQSGRLDLIRRLFKMVEVMVLYVRILNTVCGNLEEERKLARKMLDDRGIEFPSNNKRPLTSIRHQDNNNREKVLPKRRFTTSELPSTTELSHTTGITSTSTTFTTMPEKGHLLQRLLGPKQREEIGQLDSDVVIRRSPSHKNFFTRWAYESYETIQREFNWPWDGSETWDGIQKAFALLLMLFGLFLICRISFIPACESANLVLTHVQPPRI